MFPIRDTIPSRNVPLATWALVALNVVVFLFQLRLSDPAMERFALTFGIVPLRYTHPLLAMQAGLPLHGYVSFLTSMFLHGGWFHIISNMWILWIFGDNVEDRMGPARFLVFYLICGVCAGAVHVAAQATSKMPVIGASGAIAGVLAAYLFLFPLARIICLIPIFFYPLFVEIHAVFFIAIWFFSQFLSGTQALMAPSRGAGIAWWAHIGGFAAGAALYRLFIRKPQDRRMELDEYGIEGAWRRF